MRNFYAFMLIFFIGLIYAIASGSNSDTKIVIFSQSEHHVIMKIKQQFRREIEETQLQNVDLLNKLRLWEIISVLLLGLYGTDRTYRTDRVIFVTGLLFLIIDYFVPISIPYLLIGCLMGFCCQRHRITEHFELMFTIIGIMIMTMIITFVLLPIVHLIPPPFSEFLYLFSMSHLYEMIISKKNWALKETNLLYQKIISKINLLYQKIISKINWAPRETNQAACLVCLVNPRDVLLRPCKHVCGCRECINRYIFGSVKEPNESLCVSVRHKFV